MHGREANTAGTVSTTAAGGTGTGSTGGTASAVVPRFVDRKSLSKAEHEKLQVVVSEWGWMWGSLVRGTHARAE